MSNYFYQTSGGANDSIVSFTTLTGNQLSGPGATLSGPTLYAFTASYSSGNYNLVGGNPNLGDFVVYSINSDFTDVGSYIAAGTYDGYTTNGGNPIINVSASIPGYINPGNPQDIYQVLGTSNNTPPYTTVTASVFCFLSGTLIATPDGEVPVEDLKPGDIVSTAAGGTRKVLWVGEQKVSTVFGSPKNYPIEICISALGNNLPKRPLRVSPGHSLLVDGAFPIASALVNGSTVRQLTRGELPEVFTYYHVEVQDHALILAEGVPAETFLDAWSRRTFSNWQEYVELYGEEERNVPPSELHYQRVLTFGDLPQSLKDTLGEPLDAVGEQAA